MTYSIIGTGNTAWFLATRLKNAGHICKAIYGRNVDAAYELATVVNSNAFDLANGVADDTDVCIIAISDHAISEVVAKLKFNNAVLLHTAGAVSIDVLADAAKEHGVIWPVYSIVKDNLPATMDIPTVWEAASDKAALQIASMLDSITNIQQQATTEQRQWLHLTAVMSNNFTNHLFSISEQLCNEHHLPFQLLQPIIQQTVSRLVNSSPKQQQTGPAKRNDTVTLTRQMNMLQDHAAWQKVYDALSASIKEMYSK